MRLLLLVSLLALVSLSYEQSTPAPATTAAGAATTAAAGAATTAAPGAATTAAAGAAATTAAATTTAASTTAAATTTTRVPCTNPCTHNYKPVCGIYNGRQRNFENPCIFKANRRCARRRGTLARLGIRFLHVGRCNQNNAAGRAAGRAAVRAAGRAAGNGGRRVARRRRVNG